MENDGNQEGIFQKILETGDGGGNLKELREELMSGQASFREQFIKANPAEAGRVKKYLWDIVKTGNEFAYLFTS